MNGNHLSRHSKFLTVACGVQAGAAAVAALAACVDVETILVSCPAIAFWGLVLSIFSIPRISLHLLLFGLSCPVATSTIALLIASFEWGPDQAELPVQVLLVLNAGVTVVWGTLTGRRIIRSCSLDPAADKARFRFSLMSLLAIVTFTCVVLALLGRLAPKGEMVFFTAYGVGVLALSLAVAVSYSYRSKCAVRMGTDNGHTIASPAIRNAS
jgi:hypothetical protein